MTQRLGNTCVFGSAWGDEGKGKIVDLLCPGFDVVVRFNGGANAGHTVKVGNRSFALHLLPSGVLHEHGTNVIGPGVVVDPEALLAEADSLMQAGVDPMKNLKISGRAHIVMPYHKIEDQKGEQNACDDRKIGTTARGIGPCYADKMRRHSAVRMVDLLDPASLEQNLETFLPGRNRYLQAEFGLEGELSVKETMETLRRAAERLAPHICDTTTLLHEAIDGGRNILFEGANGMLLDVDHGTYPFVTSSSTGPHGIGPGAGVPAAALRHVIGVIKAYATRVGSGPFFTELDNEIGNRIRTEGNEFGTTTGRPRRCGWFDAVMARYAARLSGMTDLALMHLDTLSGFDEVGIATGYMLDDKPIGSLPASPADAARVQPIIEFLPGWKEDLRKLRRFEELPSNTRRYIERIESLVGVRVSLVGIGPDRSQTLVRGELQDAIDVPEPSAV